MNAKTLLYCLLGILFIGLVSFKSFKKAESKTPEVDVVMAIKPVAESAWQQAFVEKVQQASNDTERKAILENEGKKLSIYLATFVRRWGDLKCNISNMELVYSSGTAKSVSSGDGKEHSGYFKNQVYAKIKGGGCFGKQGTQVFARCTNMTVFEVVSSQEELTVNSVPDLVIEITKGSRLEDQVDIKTAVDLAELFSLPVYFGEEQNELTQMEYRLARDEKFIGYISTGGLQPGDRINVANMTINDIPANTAGNYRS